MTLDALKFASYKDLNDAVKALNEKEITIQNAYGQRYLGCGLKDKLITVNGTAGNGTGAYLDGAKIIINGNAQDAIADTMNSGEIVIYGDCGDTVGYGMRGGVVYIRGNVGYRAGIHMKAYKENFPVMVIGGRAGSFLGEYQAGGLIIVLGLYDEEKVAGYYCGSGMHGGKIVLRANKLPSGLSSKVNAKIANNDDLKEYENYIKNFCEYFGFNFDEIMNHNFYEITPNSKTPYKQLYTYN